VNPEVLQLGAEMERKNKVCSNSGEKQLKQQKMFE